MVFQWTMGRRLVVGCMSILISSALLADTVLQKRVLIGVKVRITPVVQVIWGDTEKKETPVELRETLLKVLRKEFRHWYFQPKEEVDTKYTLTLDVWEKDSKEIAILAWMDDGRPDSRAVDKRTDKFLFRAF